MDAREWFDDVRRAAIALGPAEAELAALYGPGSPAGVGVRSGSAGDGGMLAKAMSASRLRDEVAELEHVVGAALKVVAGVRAGMGERYADALELRYIDAMPWDEVAERIGCKRRRAMELRDIACDWVDSVGMACVAGGYGDGDLKLNAI